MNVKNPVPFESSIPRLLKPEEAAAILSISRSFIYGLIKRGELPSVRIGRACRIRLQDLQEFIEKNLHRGSNY